MAHTRTRQRLSMGRTQRPATNNQYSRGQQPSLSFFANSTEENLSAVTIVHRLQYSSEQAREAGGSAVARFAGLILILNS